MKRIFLITALLLLLPIMTTAQSRILLTVGERSMTATLVDNEATRALLSILEEGPMTVSITDYGGFEKVGALPQALPTSNSQITTVPGDIMLYQGNNMVIFYGSNSWSYTRLGKIDGATVESLHQFLGAGDISLMISLTSSADLSAIHSENFSEEVVYDLNGNIIKTRPLSPGFHIINGKKVLIRH